MDCDGSLDPGELPAVTAPVADGSLDLCLGARQPVGRGAWPWHARLANRRSRSSCAGAPAATAARPRPDARDAPRVAAGARARRTARSAGRSRWCCAPTPPAGGSARFRSPTARAAAERSKVSGSVAGTWRAVARHGRAAADERRRDACRRELEEPPPGPFRPGFWRSPLRGPWLTSLLGTLLAPAIVIMALTGLISHDAYHPELRGNATISPAHDIGVLLQFPTSGPSWIYALTQGLHVTVGLITIPLLLAKLWSVIPKLFQWPAVRSAANAIERLSLLLLVGGALFEFATGVLNIQYYYAWHYNFVTAHYWGAWVFFARSSSTSA